MREHGTFWETEERSLQKAIDNIFDHKSPSQKAQTAREYFHNQKPSLTDYLLWKKQDSDGKVYVPSAMPKEIKTPIMMQKIRMVTSFFEKAMMPDEMLPDEVDNLDAAIIKATRAIRQKPRNFFNHPYFRMLMKLLADTHGTYVL